MNPALFEKVCIPPEIDVVLRQGASLMLSVSGGKDSDSLTEMLPALRHAHGWTGPIFLAYADLQESDWLMTHAYVHRRATELGLPLYVVTRPQGTLLEHMHDRHRVVSSVTSEKKRIKIHKITNRGSENSSTIAEKQAVSCVTSEKPYNPALPQNQKR